MIVFKENGNVFMATSAVDFITSMDRRLGETEENVPMFGLSDGKTVIGFDTINITVADAVRYGNIEVPEILDEKALFANIIPQIKETLSDYGYGKNPLSSTAVVVLRGERAFACFGDIMMHEIGEYYSVGACDQLEFALLDKTREIKGEERIRKIYNIRDDCLGRRYSPIIYIDTKTRELHFIKADDRSR